VTSLPSGFLLFWSRGREQQEVWWRGDILGSNVVAGQFKDRQLASFSDSGSLQSLFV
jgi:hypothetical protein